MLKLKKSIIESYCSEDKLLKKKYNEKIKTSDARYRKRHWNQNSKIEKHGQLFYNNTKLVQKREFRHNSKFDQLYSTNGSELLNHSRAIFATVSAVPTASSIRTQTQNFFLN